MAHHATALASSYRDPSGFMFESGGILYRQVNMIFKEQFDHFISSGCYAHLSSSKLLIPHTEADPANAASAAAYKVLKPEQLHFISYCYEWSFDMLKDAALLTLQIAKEALQFGCILKDATPFNIQWRSGRPVFIDTLSFEKYEALEPWIAYRQFCECFLSPLLLMHYSKQSLQSLQLAYPDGIPLAVTKSLLPWRSKFSVHTYLHIHLHAGVTGKRQQNAGTKKVIFSKQKMLNLLNSLESLVKSLHWKNDSSTWAHYYEEASQRSGYLEAKKKIVSDLLNELRLKTAVDLGANDGAFSKMLAAKKINTIATDFDAAAINKLYLQIKQEHTENILPLLMDLSTPAPAIGVNNEERPSFLNRINADLSVALALIHHLCIGKNIPFEKLATMFARTGNYLLIEFVPKEDEKVQLMLRGRQDIFHDYTEANFIAAFSAYFHILKKEAVASSGRTIYLLKKNETHS
jgi:hypothetical protein